MRSGGGAACALALWLLGAVPGARAAPPSTPLINEPSEGAVVNPADTHMEVTGFADPDGDAHQCTDWEMGDGTGNLLRAGAGRDRMGGRRGDDTLGGGGRDAFRGGPGEDRCDRRKGERARSCER